MQGIKHLIECHCVLPQFRDRPDPVYHRFTVFSMIDDDDNVIPKHAQCNNCGVIHRIVDVGKSRIDAGRESSVALVSIEDVKLGLPSSVTSVLEMYGCDLATWEQVSWALESSSWGTQVVLTSEEKSGVREGKCLRIVGPSTIKVEPFSISLQFPTR